MRIRTIKPEFWRSDDIDALCIEDRLLFVGLWSYVDDSGVGIDKESSIAADLFAGDLARDFMETSLRVQGGLKRLHAAGLIERYEAGGRRFIHVVNFPTHQKINRPTPSRYPPPTSGNPIPPDPSGSAHGELSEDSLRARMEQGNRGHGEPGSGGSASAAHAPASRTHAPAAAATVEHVPPAELNATATRPRGYRLVTDWAQHNPGSTTAHRRALGKRVDELLASGANPAHIPRALDLAHGPRWRDPVGALPHAYEDARREAATPAQAPLAQQGTTGERVATILALKGPA